MNCPLSIRANAPEASRRGSRMSRLTWAAWLTLVWLVAASPRPAAAVDVAPGFRVDVVATGVPRPIQLALDARGALVVLSPGWSGNAAGEIYRLDIRGTLPINAAHVPRVVIPFADDGRKTVLGSLALDPRSGDLFLGEENGNRIYRLGDDQRLQAIAVGLNHLLGGGALTLDRHGRLVFLDYASPETHLRSETPLPPSLRWLIAEGYQGPLVFRIDPREARPLPRRADLLVPILPRTETPRADREPMWRLIAVTATPDDDLVFLSAVGEVFRLGSEGDLRLVVRLPAGHYHRTNLTTGPTGASSSVAATRFVKSSGSRRQGTSASWPASSVIRAASWSTPRASCTSPKQPSTASSASRPPADSRRRAALTCRAIVRGEGPLRALTPDLEL